MKKLPVAGIAAAADNRSAQKVDQLAEKSLQEREVLTETMAEVWEKQWNAEKAIEIYNKLSLLEPLKSAYFAAKIEELKKKNWHDHSIHHFDHTGLCDTGFDRIGSKSQRRRAGR